MRIVLVHPAGSNWIPGKKDVTTAANRMAPLGLLSIAAYLEQEGHQVFVHDCLGPKAPAGKEKNWIQTVPEKGFFMILRLYGPLEPWFDKTWRPGKIELIN